MKKSILILKGSPREGGNSAVLADWIGKGAAAAGAAVESVFLPGLHIQPCTACDHCRDTGVCILDDDMQALYPKLREADGIVFASPIYWFTYSAQLKACIDRCYALWNGNPKVFAGKPWAIALAYGDSDLETSGGINAVRTFESMAGYVKARIVGIVHASLSDIGDAHKHPDLLEQAARVGKQMLIDPD